jgi:hypothetical protein
MAQVTFGLCDWIDRGQAPLHQLYEERPQLLEVADAAGFCGYHLAEHHATPLGMAPSPALFLTATAQRTRRMRLQLRHLRVCLGHLPARADAALAPPVCRGSDAGLRWQSRAAGIGPRQTACAWLIAPEGY